MKCFVALGSAMLLGLIPARGMSAQTLEAPLGIVHRFAARTPAASVPLTEARDRMELAARHSLLLGRSGLRVERAPLGEALSELARQASVPLVYSPSLLPRLHVSCQCESWSVGRALDHLLAGTGFRYVEAEGQIIVRPDRVMPRSRPDTPPALALLARPAGTAVVRTNVPSPGRNVAMVEEGTVTGRVVQESTLRPIAGVQVYAPGTEFGTLTSSDGRFVLANLPDGEILLRAQMLGYDVAEQTVVVQPGASVSVEFQLREQALALDEVVVTGTAGQARRREVGNTIAQIRIDEVTDAPTTIDGLLQGRVAGVQVGAITGQAGSGGDIRLRGVSSIAMSNQPLVYVDGVRVRSDAYPDNNPPVGGSAQLYGPFNRNSPLNDINPADIERIEIVKGAAAATLYGSEAAAGVIQIFTKRGRTGAPVWDLQIDQGFAKQLPFGVRKTLRGTPVSSFDKTSPAGGTPEYWFMDPWLRTGWQQGYNLSLRGGAEQLQYHMSGSYSNSDHPLPNDHDEKLAVRGNFSMGLTSNIRLDWNTSLSRNDISNTATGNNVHGLTLNVIRRDKNYFSDESFEKISSTLEQELTTRIDHLTTGLTLNYAPLEAFTNRVTIGYDRAEWDGVNVRPYGFSLWPQGFMSLRQFTSSTLTFDYAGTYVMNLLPDLRASWSAGVQGVSSEEHTVSGWSEEFAGPGLVTLSSGAQRSTFEDRIRVITGGAFAQGLFDIRDRYFLTLGLRVDGNSAFGEDLGLQVYPKASFSYVLSDEPFWQDQWGEVKLRAAYGFAGRAPGAFDAVRTWDPAGWGGLPSFRPRTVGNPELGPERSSELELGFDASVLSNRITTEFTYYQQKVTGALMNVSQIPSNGNWGSQLENVGELENKGIELSVDARIIEVPSFTWELGGALTTNHSKVLSLGGAPSFSVGNYGFIIEGEPVGVIRGARLMNPHEVADPIIEQNQIYGPSQPTHIIVGHTAFDFPRGISLSARGEYQGGSWINDGGTRFGLTRGADFPHCYDAAADIAAGRADDLTAQERVWCIPQNLNGDVFMYPRDFFKLREVAISAPVGFLIPGASNATLTVAGRNLYTWLNDDFLTWDPEQGGFFGSGYIVSRLWEHVPPPAVFTASLRMSF